MTRRWSVITKSIGGPVFKLLVLSRNQPDSLQTADAGISIDSGWKSSAMATVVARMPATAVIDVRQEFE